MTVDQLFEEYATWHKASGHSDRTVDWYKSEVKRFLDWVQAHNLQSGNWLARSVIERYLAEGKESGLAPATVAGHYRALQGFFGWLAGRGYLERSPMVEIKPPKVPKTVPKRVDLTAFTTLVDAIESDDWVGLRDRLIVNTLFLSGLRAGEMLSLTVGDYLLSEGVVTVRKGKTGARIVPMLPAVQKAFVGYIYARPAWPTPEICLAADGGRNPKGVMKVKGVYQMLRRRCARLGIPMMNPHSFRHGMAMYLLNEGGDMSLVQKVLGHAQISTTARHYAEWTAPGMVKEFSERMKSIGG